MVLVAQNDSKSTLLTVIGSWAADHSSSAGSKLQITHNLLSAVEERKDETSFYSGEANKDIGKSSTTRTKSVASNMLKVQQSTFSSGSAMQMLPQVNVANPSQFIQSGTKSASKGSNSKPESNSDHFYHPQAIREVQEAVVEHEGRKPVGKVTIGSWAADHPKTTQSLQQGRVLDHLHKVAVVQALSAKAVVPENNIQQLVNNAGMQQPRVVKSPAIGSWAFDHSSLHQVVEDAKQKALQALKSNSACCSICIDSVSADKFYHTPDVSEIATAIVSHDHTK
mmetsp:Transcript_12559/g.43744  ORF Transcript_12559/g.43744 Transcript_12559/m.43744 type:complete len:281 (+) Transcript_12559:368-1210(+)